MLKREIVRRSVPESYQSFPGLPEFLSRIYASRGIESPEELELGLKQLLDNRSLLGVDSACELLVSALTQDKKILIVGDFDADGATSTALAVLALRAMGAQYVDYLVPNRFEFGYGLTPEIVALAAKGSPDLIVTVDNGISSIEGVKVAKELGIRVLVTDHHLPVDQVPKADAIVNPNQKGCEFLSKNAAGVGVIFYVLTRLRLALRERGWFSEKSIPEPSMADYLDLVALGTVADLVPLDHNNRIMVEQGLRRIRAGRCRPGILALLSVAGKNYQEVVASDMGFLVGPRLNAAGRLDDMSLGIECLLAQDEAVAFELASRLDSFNRERKSIEEEMKRDALAQLSEMNLNGVNSAWGVCLFEAHWHQGVIGILASRVKERLHRPVIVFAPESDDPHAENTHLKGSGRSVPGLHLRDALDLLAKRHPDLLQKFGGHAMAAGMSIKQSHLPAFTLAFDEVVRELMSEDDLSAKLMTDGELEGASLTLPSVELLAKAGPWGQQFPEPSFDGVFHVAQVKVLKEKHLKLVLVEPSSGLSFDAIQFNSEWVKMQPMPQEIRVVYRPNINEFRGRRSVQFFLDYIERV
jgi:single-stranded-DNA-specific exonuclease